jgi:ABC-2 type transport system ATP-binding protein
MRPPTSTLLPEAHLDRPRSEQPPPAVEIRDLVKRYPDPDGGTFNAVDGLSLDVRHGEVLAVLGPNGAGKTTTLEILEGLTRPTSGTARVLGLDVTREPRAVKQRIGVQLQASSYFEHLTLLEILRLFGSFYGRALDPHDLLDRVGLADRGRALVGHLSGGQAQRFSIVAALVNDPDVVFLDEPTTGLDPQARRNLWDLVASINADDGTTVILTTHAMEEAEVLADRVAIVDAGRLVDLDTTEALIAGVGATHAVRFTTSSPWDDGPIARLPGVVSVRPCPTPVGTAWRIDATRPERAVPALFALATSRGVDLRDLRVEAPTLEDVFLARTGRALRD